jgi:hypothetical protein
MRQFEDGALKISVWEMNRAQALSCQRDFNAFLESGETNGDRIAEEIDYLLVKHAPCRVEYQTHVLEIGAHRLELDGVSYILTLPLTRAGFDSLPYFLTFQWGKHASEANPFTANFLWVRRRLIQEAQMTAVLTSESGHSPA